MTVIRMTTATAWVTVRTTARCTTMPARRMATVTVRATPATTASPIVNGNQADGDSDGIGDLCDACSQDAQNDGDSDGHCADADNCPASTQLRPGGPGQ